MDDAIVLEHPCVSLPTSSIFKTFTPLAAFIFLSFAGFALADPPPCPPGVSCHFGDNCTYSNINPLCGGTAEIDGVAYSFGGLCTRPIVPAIRILGSPSGLAHNGGHGIRIRLFRAGGARLDPGREVWLQVAEGGKPDLLDSGPTRLECSNGQGAVVHYLEGYEAADTTAEVIYPSFGGHGAMDIAIEICCPPYYCPVMPGAFEGVSTDIDDDGDTDEADEAILRTSMSGAFDPRCDLNFDGVVDQADYDILMLEARRRVRGNGCELDAGAFAQVRPAAIGTLAAIRTGPSGVQLQWTATGDDSLTGTAWQYEVRSSSRPIDEDNFASATLVTGAPAPAAAGTVQGFSASIDSSQCYFAMKVMDDAGNWSALSNVPRLASQEIDFSLAAADPGSATLRFACRCPPALAGHPLELTVLDVAGRRIASSGILTAGAGRNEIHLRPATGSLRAGVYLARLRLGSKTLSLTFSVIP